MAPGQEFDLSIIIPAFNEARRLPETLRQIAAYFEPRRRFQVEIIVVNDGSSDATAGLLAQAPRAANLNWRMLNNPGNRGKGYSVRHGMRAARGRVLLLTDADLSAPIREIERLQAALAAGCDIAIGSRSRRELIRAHQSRFRENAGRIFNLVVRLALGLRFTDTQCGFKLFSRDAAEAIFPLQRIERWGFDPELLFLARQRGLRVAEVPVVWAHADGAKIHMFRDSARMFVDVLQIRANALRGRYPMRAAAAAAAPLPAAGAPVSGVKSLDQP